MSENEYGLSDRDYGKPTPTRVPMELTFHGQNSEIIKLALMNFPWNVLTLSFFRFWGRTRVRRYFWGHTHLNGEAFEYTGRGVHIFIGFLIVAVGFVAATLVLEGLQLWLAGDDEEPLGGAAAVFGIANLIYIAGIFVLLGIAIYAARHYRLSHTNWRGIRGAMIGSRFKFSMLMIGYTLLMMFSYGLTYPLYQMAIFGRLMRESSFGDRVFGFKGYAGRIYPAFLLLIPAYIMFVVVLLIGAWVIFGNLFTIFEGVIGEADGHVDEPTNAYTYGVAAFVGLYIWIIFSGLVTILPAFAFYRTREFQAFADGTDFNGLKFSFEVSTGSLVKLFLSNYFIVLFSLGILGPLAQQRIFRFFCQNLKIIGELDLEAIRQSALAKPERGEGLAEAFDFGTV